ncbi:DUF58 domain-containing protein [Colwellia psychrerythraea]|uniref:Uncharacterized protein n=1 Tax=Colwellia psychrerythraea TaxID=28229 RepID=A0A099KT06_COLPS|nr:DUF58 domain-containing protein [Colwellia psychrerythraea]KGJ92803.1 protein of unknown function DUF58 [Colwellia psychrerythraea]
MATTSGLSLAKWIRKFFQKNFERWLARRIPSQSEHQLNSRNIMIYPTRFGLAYLGFVILVFLLGTNYQNNIILLLSYLLASLFISVMLHSFYNFSQLRFYSRAKQQGYAEEPLNFSIKIMAKKNHYDINVHFSDRTLNSQIVTLLHCKQGEQELTLAYKSSKRGRHNLGRITIYSEYCLGIFKSKTVLNFGHYAIIYPKAKSLIAGQYQLSSSHDEASMESFQSSNIVGTDDFSELKSFVRGESRARTAWKQLAKGQGHFSKHYQASTSQLQWLKLSEMPSNNLEIQLAYLSFLIGELSTTNQNFGLDLSAETANKAMNIQPNSGFKHQQECLTALALYS